MPQFLILEIVPVIPRNCKIQGVTLKKERRLVGFHGSVELHHQHRRGVCGLKERPMTQLGKLSLHNSWIQQLSQSPIHPKRNEDVPEAQSVFCEHQSSPVQSSPEPASVTGVLAAGAVAHVFRVELHLDGDALEAELCVEQLGGLLQN